MNPELWGMSVCTVDGQRASFGDAASPFCLQSVSKPFIYAIVHNEIGAEELHSHVGQAGEGKVKGRDCRSPQGVSSMPSP